MKYLMEKMRELTIASIFIGIGVAIVMTAANVYLGLKAGMTVSASIPAAVVSLALFRSFLKKSSIHESNIVQTMASAGESLAAGIIFTVPALVLIGAWKDFEFWPTTIIAITGGLLGILFMIPLRKALVVDDKKLTYPEGVACAAVLETGSSNSKSGLMAVVKGVLIGGAVKLVSSGFHLVAGSLEYAARMGKSVYFIGSDLSPAMIAVGYIVKLEIAALVISGGIVGFIIGIPLLGIPESLESASALDIAWTLWSTKIRYIGVGAMVVGGLWSIVSVRSGILAGISGLKSAYTNKAEAVHQTNRDMSLLSMLVIFLLCLVGMFSLYTYLIDTLAHAVLTTVIMIFASFLFVAVSSYICGLVGSSNNPVSGMVISALIATGALFLVFGFEGDSAILATLGVASIVCCAACTAGDCSQDLKTGSLLKTTPRSQQIAQMIGVVIPAFFIAPILTVLHEAYVIGEGLMAPQAALFASVAGGMFGKGEIPMNMVFIGVALALLILFIDQVVLRKSKIRLHIMPMAVGIYLPFTITAPIFIGGLVRYFVDKKRTNVSEGRDPGILGGSGLIAGEALMGVFIAILLYLGVGESIRIDGISHDLSQLLGFGVLIAVIWYLYRSSLKKV